jgi:hypothetical protein
MPWAQADVAAVAQTVAFSMAIPLRTLVEASFRGALFCFIGMAGSLAGCHPWRLIFQRKRHAKTGAKATLISFTIEKRQTTRFRNKHAPEK